MNPGTKGTYIMPAIPPWCREIRTPATFVEERPNGRILLSDDTIPNYLIETTPDAFIPHEL